MIDATIHLEIRQSAIVPADPDDIVPWRLAMAVGPENGHKRKKHGFYYRFIGGNTVWDDETPVGNGDFEFKQGTGVKTVDIFFLQNSNGWRFEGVEGLAQGGPLTANIPIGGKTVRITDDTGVAAPTSGTFGVRVSQGAVELYCDPDWDNR